MEIIGWIKSLIAGLTEVGLMLLALAIVASLLVGGALPFFGGVVGNIIALVKDLGSNGLVGIWPPDLLSGKTAYYFATLLLAGGAILLIWRSAHAPLGYLLRAGRDSRIRAEAVGVDVRLIQWRAIILAGVTIGSRAVIGAGSVVTGDVPEGVFAAGNPCRVIRENTE